MSRYLLALALVLPMIACNGGGSGDPQRAEGVSVSLQWPPSIAGAVHSSAFGLPSGVSSIDMTVDFFGSDFDPGLHSMRIERLSDGTEQTTVDDLIQDPLGPQVTFDVPAGANRGIFIAGVALLEGGKSVAFSGLATFDVDPVATTVTVNLSDGDGRPQPPAIGVQGADAPVVNTSLLLTGQARFPDGTAFQDTITSIVSSDSLVAMVDSLTATTISLLAVGPVTLTIEFAYGGPLDLNLDVASGAVVTSMSGTWTITETLLSGGCPGDPTTQTYDIVVTQNGSSISVQLPTSEVLVGQVSGNQFSWDQSYPEDGGTTTELLNGTVSADGLSLTADSSWSWTDGITSANDCSGTSNYTGTLLQ